MEEMASERGLLGEAAAHATASVPVAGPADSASEVRSSLAGASFESADEVAVLDGRTLVGVVSLERLFAAEAATPVSELVDTDPPALRPDSSQEEVARKAVSHRECAIAVVGESGEFVGLIPAPRLIGVLLDEHDEDMARLGGYLVQTAGARHAAEERVSLRLWHRLPWLVVGLIGALASAVIVGSFEEQLEAKVLVAFFVPAVVYMADAVGTQTETLLIRGLALGVTVREVLKRELITGALIGLMIAAVFFPFAALGWGDTQVALAVALALFASCGISTAVAMILPATLQRLGRDPAFGSGPLATIVQDLLSIAVYLAIATAIAI